MPSLAPLPTFLIIGAQKSATRWLRVNLGAHPDVFTADDELWFFNDVEGRFSYLGTEWYRAQFAGWDGETFVGESTPGYMMLRHDPAVVAQRIDTTIPDVRLIAVLRDPVARAQSAVVHHVKRNRISPDARLIDLVRHHPDVLDRRSIVEGGLYAQSLRPYIERFGDRLLITLHDDVTTDAVGVYRRSCVHIGADFSFLPPGLGEVRFSNQPAKAKRPIVAAVTEEERNEIFALFRDDVDALEELIGRDLRAWRPG